MSVFLGLECALNFGIPPSWLYLWGSYLNFPPCSPRNQQMAAVLNEAGFATILMDLLTQKEDEVDRYTREFRFNIPMLAKRMVEATDWVRQQSDIGRMPVGYFGASTGAAAALIAAAERDDVQVRREQRTTS